MWSSSDASTAAVDEMGLVQGIAEGSATITATAGGAHGTSEITVANPDRAALVALYRATGGPNWTNSENWLTDAPLEDWYGVSTDRNGRVWNLSLSWNALAGSVPPEIGNLSQLIILTLNGTYNNRYARTVGSGLTGPLPQELARLSNLEYLYLNTNRLTGEIPAELGDLSNLHFLHLDGNELTGPLPPRTCQAFQPRIPVSQYQSSDGRDTRRTRGSFEPVYPTPRRERTVRVPFRGNSGIFRVWSHLVWPITTCRAPFRSS